MCEYCKARGIEEEVNKMNSEEQIREKAYNTYCGLVSKAEGLYFQWRDIGDHEYKVRLREAFDS